MPKTISYFFGNKKMRVNSSPGGEKGYGFLLMTTVLSSSRCIIRSTVAPINHILILCLSIFLIEEAADSNYAHDRFSLIFLLVCKGGSLASRHKN